MEEKHCKWYNDEFCTNGDSPCVADYCPVVEYPELCKFRETEVDEDINVRSKTQRRRGGMMESVEERLKRIIECVKCPETGSEHFGEWGILTREQRLFLNNLARDTIDLLDCMDKKIRETQYKIEQGTLIELPCKVGDTVYCVYAATGIQEWEVGGIQISESTVLFLLGHKGTNDYNAAHLSEKGSYLFFTREEAEKRLKELQNE
jgi:hypothetical protein